MGAGWHGESRYRIEVKGILDPHWAAYFDGQSLSSDPDTCTTTVNGVRDQAALLGVLRRMHGLGVEIIGVTLIGSEESSIELQAFTGLGARPGLSQD
jgi:hypothetical protein